MNIQFEVADAFDKLSEMKSNSANCAVVDYPWSFDCRNGSGRFEFSGGENIRENDEHMYRMEKDNRVPELLDLLSEVLRGGSWIVFFSDDRFQDTVRQSMKNNENFVFRRNWAWKTNSIGMGYYGRVNHYPMPVCTVGETDRYVQDRPTLFEVDSRSGGDYPTSKPFELIADVLSPPVLKAGDRLLEPFCGLAPGAQVVRQRVSEEIDYWGCDVDGSVVQRAREMSVDGPSTLL